MHLLLSARDQKRMAVFIFIFYLARSYIAQGVWITFCWNRRGRNRLQIALPLALANLC